MNLLKRRNSHIFIIVFLIGIFLFSRLYHLLLLPIFTDESIYIFWAKRIVTERAHWLISLTDGKPPLLVWMISSFLLVLPSDLYLLAGRLPSVIAGFFSLIGMYKLSTLLFEDRKVGYIAMLLYIFTPFTLFYDRMALFDSLLCATMVWSVYFAIKTAKSMRLEDAIFWGFLLGLGFLSKPPAILFFFLTPLCFLLFIHKSEIYKNWKKILLLLVIPIFLSQAINNAQRVSGAYVLMQQKNQQFQQPISDIIADPFRYAKGNIYGLFDWMNEYTTSPLFAFAFFSCIFLFIEKRRIGATLLLLWFGPLFAFAIIGRELFPRYLVFLMPYFLLPLAYVFAKIFTKNIFVKTSACILFFIIFLPALFFDHLILTDPKRAPFPIIDYHQYISDHPSGYGLSEIFSYIDKKLEKEKITLVTEGTFGLYPYAFKLHYWDNKQIEIMDRWPLTTIDQDIIGAKLRSTVYLVYKEYRKVPVELPGKLILTIEKPGGRFFILLTKLEGI